MMPPSRLGPREHVLSALGDVCEEDYWAHTVDLMALSEM